MKECKGGMKMYDTVELIEKGSVVQHGVLNDRVYLMKLDKNDVGIILDSISTLATDNEYSKIFCKVPKSVAPLFFADGYIFEAYIPRFYNDQEDVFFVSKFLDPDRLLHTGTNKLSGLNKLLSGKLVTKDISENASDYHLRRLCHSDVGKMASIYREVFESYPFPIHDSRYILKTMDENVQYFCAEKNGKLAALASSEVDVKGKNAEMTDFATLPEHAGHNLSSILLQTMEEEMKKQGIKTLYTIARLNSIPMNKTFLRQGYEYSGTLINNTNIAGEIESMNVYYKHI